ncbi:MAG: DUF1573 domain-containing protein [Candidatus Sulfobium sp.]|jgi:hypothetical protein
MASSGRLKPGETGKIRVAVDLRGRSGSLTKTVHVYTNDPRKPATDLSVKMEVRRETAVKKRAVRGRF